jgi:hypothetical protein
LIPMKYCIDTSFLLDAWRRKYPPDHFPPFWQYIDSIVSRGEMKSPEEVLEDLKKKDDDVYRWAKDREELLFVPIDNNSQQEVRSILERFENLIKQRTGRSSSDPWVIALAKLNAATVITTEGASTSPNPLKPKIPDVCTALGIKYIDTLQFIRQEGIIFNSLIINNS